LQETPGCLRGLWSPGVRATIIPVSQAPPQQVYSRREARRALGISEAQLRSWEKQGLVPSLESLTFSDLIALRTLQKLRKNKASLARIRRAVSAIREKLGDVGNPLTELKLFCEGRKVGVIVDGRKMEPISGQLLLDFDREELSRLLSFPQSRPSPERPSGPPAQQREAEFWFQKGLELEHTGAPPAEIIQAYDRAVTLDSQSAGAWVNLGTIHYHLRDWAQTERCYRQALQVDPTYALAHFNLGNLYDEQGNSRQALVHYHAALDLDPGYADAHYNLALLCQTQGDPMKALRHWTLYLKLDPSSSWAAIARRELDQLRRAALVPGPREAAGKPPGR